MAYVDRPMGELRMEKSIVIDSQQAKQMEARGQILPSDEYVDRDRGENLAPGQFVQETVDAATAHRMAAAKGITLAESVDAAAGVNMNYGNNSVAPVGSGNSRGSKMPAAILESFRKQPPIIPEMQSTAADFNPEFIAGVQEANRRLNKAGGTVVPTQIPSNAAAPLHEGRSSTPMAPPNYGGNTPAPSYPSYPQYSAPQQSSAGIDYSIMVTLMKEAVRDVLKETNLKDIVKEVLKEERETLAKSAINENIQIKIGNSIFSGKISNMQAPKK